MADLNAPVSVDTQDGVGYNSQGASIDKLSLITSSGQTLELKQMMAELSYFEDIYSFSVSGSLIIRDGVGLIERFQLVGNEFLEVEFGRVKGSNQNVKKTFRVYKLSNRSASGNLNSEFFTLYFCSEELLLSEQTRISKSYNMNGSGQEIYKIVTSILKDELKVTKPMSIDETTGLQNFIAPKIKPFEAISWLSTYARPKNQPLAGADMLFFENKDGYNFKSLRGMFAQDPYNTYTYQQNNVGQTLEQSTKSVLQIEYVKSYDMLNEISSGTFANRLISVDPTTRSFKITDFNYNTYKQSSLPANGNGVSADMTNRLGKTQSTSPESVVKVVIGNSDQYRVPYIKENTGSVTNDIFIENFVPNRTAQIALANYTVLKIVVPGDPGLTAGSTIEFNIYSLQINGDNRELDKFYSGKYLINAVRHILQAQGIYQTVLEISKESYSNPVQTPSSDTTTESKK